MCTSHSVMDGRWEPCGHLFYLSDCRTSASNAHPYRCVCGGYCELIQDRTVRSFVRSPGLAANPAQCVGPLRSGDAAKIKDIRDSVTTSPRRPPSEETAIAGARRAEPRRINLNAADIEGRFGSLRGHDNRAGRHANSGKKYVRTARLRPCRRRGDRLA